MDNIVITADIFREDEVSSNIEIYGFLGNCILFTFNPPDSGTKEDWHLLLHACNTKSSDGIFWSKNCYVVVDNNCMVEIRSDKLSISLPMEICISTFRKIFNSLTYNLENYENL